MEKTHTMSENRQKWTAFIAEIKRTTHHVKKPTMVDSFHRGDRENNTPYQKNRQKWTAFIAEIEKTTHHVTKPTKVDSFHRGDRENNTPCQRTDKSGQLSSRRWRKQHTISENRQKWTSFIAEIEKTTHHVREPTKVDSFHRGDRENNTPCQKTDKSGQLSSRR
ncbi:hypothetical protein RRG08_002990 [Elysia crispata]|uniref:Uncharacterized protein n=1 Tax=Elysia crispata TaxID=231223 RepID=A0AAE1B4D8_9GAST|nr:hypothetical protein RRG08_002990 [Elysia crispata]